ncbi:hypothetical protein QUA81_08070 [Microcoleus sp. F6_B4]
MSHSMNHRAIANSLVGGAMKITPTQARTGDCNRCYTNLRPLEAD